MLRTRPLAPLLAVLLLSVALLVGAPPRLALASNRLPSAADRLPGVRLLLPVPGEVLRPFSAPKHRYGPGHRGVDLAAALGDPIRAAAPGTVAFAGRVAGRPVITLDHGQGVSTTYDAAEPSVHKGQRVQAGELIGTLTDGPNGPGLHWGLRRFDVYYDPMLHLAQTHLGLVRLLPLDAEPKPLAPVTLPELPLPVVQGPTGRLTGGIPVSGPITSPFGMRLHPVLKVWKLHDGVDFGAPCGAPVRSVGAGVVVLVEHHVAYGKRVVVDVGGGRRYGYTHLSSFGVRMGQKVEHGDYLGAIGSTGYSTGCHLHFMAWQDGRVVAPPTP